VLLGLAGDSNVLPSTVYLEGFGQGSYSRLDVKAYQGLIGAIATDHLPVVMPRYIYSYVGTPDSLGGRLSVDTGVFNVIRDTGTNTRRANLTVNWERPFQGSLGDLWKITVHGDTAAYDASQLNEQPNFGLRHNIDTATAQPGVAVDFSWPFMRDSGSWGTQLIEPKLQLVLQPRTGDSQFQRIPNEDSLSFEFSDANLFGFNRFSGIDRLEGNSRINAALHSAWYLGGTLIDGLVGQSYQTGTDNMFPVSSGLHDAVSDIVARVSISPARWLDLTYRTRLDKQSLNTKMADATMSVGTDKFRLTGGYLYSTFDPYFFYDTVQPPSAGSSYFSPRNEITAAVSSKWEHYRFSLSARRNLATNEMIYYGASAAYEDECFIFDVRFARRFTSLLDDHGSTSVLFFFTFKTVGQFGYRAL
jgi:LPS-assembly protein